eukprot:tig00020562_g11169.t1
MCSQSEATYCSRTQGGWGQFPAKVPAGAKPMPNCGRGDWGENSKEAPAPAPAAEQLPEWPPVLSDGTFFSYPGGDAGLAIRLAENGRESYGPGPEASPAPAWDPAWTSSSAAQPPAPRQCTDPKGCEGVGRKASMRFAVVPPTGGAIVGSVPVTNETLGTTQWSYIGLEALAKEAAAAGSSGTPGSAMTYVSAVYVERDDEALELEALYYNASTPARCTFSTFGGGSQLLETCESQPVGGANPPAPIFRYTLRNRGGQPTARCYKGKGLLGKAAGAAGGTLSYMPRGGGTSSPLYEDSFAGGHVRTRREAPQTSPPSEDSVVCHPLEPSGRLVASFYKPLVDSLAAAEAAPCCDSDDDGDGLQTEKISIEGSPKTPSVCHGTLDAETGAYVEKCFAQSGPGKSLVTRMTSQDAMGSIQERYKGETVGGGGALQLRPGRGIRNTERAIEYKKRLNEASRRHRRAAKQVQGGSGLDRSHPAGYVIAVPPRLGVSATQYGELQKITVAGAGSCYLPTIPSEANQRKSVSIIITRDDDEEVNRVEYRNGDDPITHKRPGRALYSLTPVDENGAPTFAPGDGSCVAPGDGACFKKQSDGAGQCVSFAPGDGACRLTYFAPGEMGCPAPGDGACFAPGDGSCLRHQGNPCDRKIPLCCRMLSYAPGDGACRLVLDNAAVERITGKPADAFAGSARTSFAVLLGGASDNGVSMETVPPTPYVRVTIDGLEGSAHVPVVERDSVMPGDNFDGLSAASGGYVRVDGLSRALRVEIAGLEPVFVQLPPRDDRNPFPIAEGERAYVPLPPRDKDKPFLMPVEDVTLWDKSAAPVDARSAPCLQEGGACRPVAGTEEGAAMLEFARAGTAKEQLAAKPRHLHFASLCESAADASGASVEVCRPAPPASPSSAHTWSPEGGWRAIVGKVDVDHNPGISMRRTRNAAGRIIESCILLPGQKPVCRGRPAPSGSDSTSSFYPRLPAEKLAEDRTFDDEVWCHAAVRARAPRGRGGGAGGGAGAGPGPGERLEHRM